MIPNQRSHSLWLVWFQFYVCNISFNLVKLFYFVVNITLHFTLKPIKINIFNWIEIYIYLYILFCYFCESNYDFYSHSKLKLLILGNIKVKGVLVGFCSYFKEPMTFYSPQEQRFFKNPGNAGDPLVLLSSINLQNLSDPNWSQWCDSNQKQWGFLEKIHFTSNFSVIKSPLAYLG